MGVFLSLLIVGGIFSYLVPVKAEDDCSGKTGEPLYTCLGEQIKSLQHDLELSKAATAPLEAEVTRLDKQIKSIQAQITAAEARQVELAASIKDREEQLAVQYLVFAQKTREHYKRLRSENDLVWFLSTVESGELARETNYAEVAADNDRQVILLISDQITGLEQDKVDLEKNAKSLASLQANLNNQADFFKGEIEGAKAYQASLTGKIASLSSLQQSILSSKAETFSTTVGDVPLADDPNSRPDYNPGFSPAFAMFSFGAPHFKGMSQYGAYGRAKSGQSAEDIIKAYYGDVRIETVDTGGNINTSVGALPFEDNYMRGIAEMPSKWADDGGMAALEAQAIAARSYAMAYVGWRMGSRSMGGSICVTESCQVYRSSKVGDANWGQAVNNTRGKIIVSNSTGEIISAWYASTSGGYQESYTTLGHSTPGFWDTKNGRDGWTSEAYEKIAGSPWFYKGWYRSRSGDSCGRDHPWLTSEEMADIINAWVVIYKNGESDDRVTPIGSCWGGNPYSLSELRSKGGYSSVSGANVVYSSDGITDNVTFQTDKGSVSIPGKEFYKAFNLRAPGRIALKSGLFNVEVK